MDDTAEMITHDGEVMQMPISIGQADQSLAIAMSRVEIDHQISTARAYPRSIDRAIKNISTLTTLDEETAASCIYALPRGNKPVQGPSIRLAEVVAGQWGNCRVGTRVVHVDRTEKVVVAEGIFHDLETNVQTTARVQRRIVDKYGKLYSDDMIIVTGNAACSIAKRNAILGGVPKGIWGGAYDRALKVVAGTVETLAVTREKAVGAFAHFGVKPEQVFGALSLEGYEDITLNHIPTLRGMFSALKNGEATVEEMFSPRIVGSAHQTVANPLTDAGPAPRPAAATQTRAAKPAQEQAPATVLPPDEAMAELDRRLSVAKSAAEIETAFSDIAIGNKLYKVAGYIDRARALRSEYLALVAARPKKAPAEDAQFTESSIAATEASSPSEATQDAGAPPPPSHDAPASDHSLSEAITPDDILANLAEVLATATDAAAIEEGYAYLDVEAELSGFEGYVEKARALKDEHLARVEKAKPAVEEAPAPPPALADDEAGQDSEEVKPFDLNGWRDLEHQQSYIGYAEMLVDHAKKVGDNTLVDAFWKDSQPVRAKLIPLKERNSLKDALLARWQKA